MPVEADVIGRYPQEAEAATYSSVLEALQSTAKKARPSSAAVRLGHDDRCLTFTVQDDGRGFDPATASMGTGMHGVADRTARALAALTDIGATEHPLSEVRIWMSTTWLTWPLRYVVDTLSVVVCPPRLAQNPLSLPLFGFASRTERSAATCVLRRRPGHAGNLREGFRLPVPLE